MKIIVLHGDDNQKSYARLTKFLDTAKKRNWEIAYDEFPNTPSLFGAERLIVYRDHKLIGKKEIKNFERFDGTLVIYHDSLLSATFVKQMPKDVKIEKFDLPRLLFTFLDSLYPGNSEHSIKLLHEVVKTEAVELVMFFVARHFRDLYWVSVDSASTGFPSWKVSKLKSQASKFNVLRLTMLIDLLSEIDIKVKTSESDLLTELDLLIVKELK